MFSFGFEYRRSADRLDSSIEGFTSSHFGMTNKREAARYFYNVD
jgi:hypothetical protein